MKTVSRSGTQLAGSRTDSRKTRWQHFAMFAAIIGFAPMLVSCAPISSAIAEGNAAFHSVGFLTSGSNLREKGFTEQAEAFVDGQVTEEEYRDSIQRLHGCVESAGYGFSDPQLNPVDGLTYEFVMYSNGRDETEALRHFNACEDRHTTPLATTYLSTHTQKMDPALKAELLHCLDSGGNPGFTQGKNLGEIAPISHADGSLRGDARNCISELVPELFPSLPSFAMYD